MNTYIILTPEIGNMGGAQMYVQNKVSFLKKKGWKVFVLYYHYSEKILIPELSVFRELYYPELAWGVQYIPDVAYRRIISRIKTVIGETEEIIIESQLLLLSFWGERLAQSLGGRHIINILEERVTSFGPKELAFFEYKLFRWEFMNSDESTLNRVFGIYRKDSYKPFMNDVVFVSSNVTSDVDTLEYSFDKCDYTISSIGRLDKEYILPMFDEIRCFVNKHPDKLFNIIVVGGSTNGDIEEKVKFIFQSTPNVKIYLLGYLFPIPQKILRTIDVGIACANSVLVTSDVGIPTICVDMNDSQAIGIFGHTTYNRFCRDKEPKQGISKLIESVLIRRDYVKSDENRHSEIDVELEKQYNYLTLSQNNSGYYDIVHLYSLCERTKAQCKWLLMHKK